MKKLTIRYRSTLLQMGDILRTYGVDMKKDFSEREKAKIRKKLEKYMISMIDKPLKINLKKIFLIVDTVDEAGHLHTYIH